MMCIEKLKSGFLISGFVETTDCEARYALEQPIDVLKHVAVSLSWYKTEEERKPISFLLPSQGDR